MSHVAVWDGSSLYLQDDMATDHAAAVTEFETPAVNGWPQLAPDTLDISVSRLVLPAEKLLLRSFSLPLRKRHLIDAEVLKQELLEQTGNSECGYWLSWHACETDHGVSGMVFGLPDPAKALFSDSVVLGQASLLPDVWVRLHNILEEARPEQGAGEASCAILDADRQGLFFGLMHNGCWRGMRRVNRAAGMRAEAVAEEVMRSLVAMGFDPEQEMVLGRVEKELGDILGKRCSRWQADKSDAAELQPRHAVTLAASSGDAVQADADFRRGGWRIRSRSMASSGWRRSVGLAAMLAVAGITSALYQVYAYQSDVDRLQQGVEQAFYRGLPNEKVILDPLAQLRAAAGGANIHGQTTNHFLQQLHYLAQLKQQPGWSLREFAFEKGEFRLRGSAVDIAAMNRTRDALAAKLGREVAIVDTQLGNGSVQFRMKWQW